MSAGAPGREQSVEPFTVRATIMQTPNPAELQVLRDHLIEVGSDGTIISVRDDQTTTADVSLAADQALLPGLIDCHIHAPQWPQLGTGLDLPLKQWLFEYTFPLEARHRDLEFAQRVWDDIVGTLLANGTTTAVYFGPVDTEATTLLAKTCANLGQRALVGRVAMDHPEQTPEWYRDPSANSGIEQSRRSIEEIQQIGSPIVRPLITPRFIPACTDDLLAGLGELAASTGVGIQTHCSEGDWEHHHVLDRCGVTDTFALDRFGLIRDHTILAHGTHLDGADLSLIGVRGAGVAHCPLSNQYFSNRIFAARRTLDAGTRVGLGTDIGAGSSASLLAQCGIAVGESVRLAQQQEGARIDIRTAFWMATVGGAELVDEPVGLIEAGRSFDAIVVNLDLPRTGPQEWHEVDDDDRIFEKVVRLTTPSSINSTWVAGRRVAGSA